MQRLRVPGLGVDLTIHAPTFQLGSEHNFSERLEHGWQAIWSGADVENEFNHEVMPC
jgi:hypothetical protein